MKVIEMPLVHEDERELRRRISVALSARSTHSNSYKLSVTVDEQRVGVEHGLFVTRWFRSGLWYPVVYHGSKTTTTTWIEVVDEQGRSINTRRQLAKG
jgi:hypothetical protein